MASSLCSLRREADTMEPVKPTSKAKAKPKAKAKKPLSKLATEFDWTTWPIPVSIRIERGLPRKLVRRLVLWTLSGSGAWGCVHSILVTRTHEPFRGWHATGRVVIRLGADKLYPMRQQYPRRPTAPTYVLADWVETLVAVSAHEFQHAFDWSSNTRINECRAERWAVKELKIFRKLRKQIGFGNPPKVTRAKILAAIEARDMKKESVAVKRDERMWDRIRVSAKG